MNEGGERLTDAEHGRFRRSATDRVKATDGAEVDSISGSKYLDDLVCYEVGVLRGRQVAAGKHSDRESLTSKSFPRGIDLFVFVRVGFAPGYDEGGRLSQG